MSDVTETLQALMERRLREMGTRRGRGESLSLHEAYERYEQAFIEQWRDELGDHPKVTPTYEVFRRIRNGHTRISDKTAAALATMLDVDVDEVYAAAGMPASLGKFKLPARADRLDDRQRQVVLSVVDAILEAGGKGKAVLRPVDSDIFEDLAARGSTE